MIRTCVLLLLCVSVVNAGWEPYVSSRDSSQSPDRASIRYAATPHFGLPTLSEALIRLKHEGHLSSLEVIVINGGGDADFQRELIEKLQESVPRELAIALDSGGSTYENPQLKPIHTSFDKIVLETATVGKVKAQLETFGKRITGASHEKLSFRHVDGELVILFFLYLDVEDQ